MSKKKKIKTTVKKLKPFRKYGFKINVLRTSIKSSKGIAYAYEFNIIKEKGKTLWLGVENYSADNLNSAKKKLLRDLRTKQKYK